MPEDEVIERAREDEREGKSASTQAGEFVREEMDHIREGKHGAQSTKQAIAIGLSKARRAGVKLPAPKARTASSGIRKKAEQDLRRGSSQGKKAPSPTRSRAISRVLKSEGHSAASRASLSRQARASAKKRGKAGLREAGRKAARTRARSSRRD